MRPVVRSIEGEHGRLCVDFVTAPDGACAYRLCRRDPEDYGRWSVVADYAGVAHANLESAYCAARARFPWLPEQFPWPATPPDPRSNA